MTIPTPQLDYCWLFIKNIYLSLWVVCREVMKWPKEQWCRLIITFLFPGGESKPMWRAAAIALPTTTSQDLPSLSFLLWISVALLPTKQSRWNSRQSMYVCFTGRTSMFSQGSDKWWEERKICLFSDFVFDVTNVGIYSKDNPSWKKLSRLVITWIWI